MNKIISFTVFWTVFLVSLLSSCKGFDPYTSLSELRDSLRTASNDTISFYCIKEKYAVWIHEENEVDDNWGSNLQTLYYYNLETKERVQLFTTFKDSVNIFPSENQKGEISGIGKIGASNDSLAILINDFEGDILMLPINKRKPVSILCLGNAMVEDIEEKDVFSHYAVANGQYRVQERTDLPEDILNIFEYPYWLVQKSYLYATSGERISIEPEAQIIDIRGGGDPIQIPVKMLDNMDELKKELITKFAYSIKDVEQIANNSVKFDETFKSKIPPKELHYFALTVHSVKEVTDLDHKDSQGNYTKRLKVNGEDFAIYTNDNSFAKLNYPCRIIILAKVNDVQRVMENPFAAMLGGMLGGVAGVDPDIRFSFTKASLLYVADQD